MGKSARWLKKLLGIKKSEKSKDKGAAAKKGDPIEHVKKPEKQKPVVITPPAPLPPHVYEQIRKLEQTPAQATPAPPLVNASPVKREQKLLPISDIYVEAAAEIGTQPELAAPVDDGDFDHVVESFADIEGVVSKEDLAAIKVQKAFKSYLARRAFRALKGVIRLQALARGHAVRRQAAATLRCIQAIVRVQAVFRGRQTRLSEEGLAVQYLLQRYRQQTDSWQFVNQESYNEIYRHRGSRKVPANAETSFVFQRQIQHCTPKKTPMFVDSALQSDSGWVWLQRWTVAQPWYVVDTVGDASPGSRNAEVSTFEDPYENHAYPKENGKQEQGKGYAEADELTQSPKGENRQYEEEQQAPAAAAGAFTDDDFPVVENSFEVSEPIVEHSPPSAAAIANGHHLQEDDEVYEEEFEEDPKFQNDVDHNHSNNNMNNNSNNMNSNNATPRSTRSVPSYMAATQSAKAKARSQSPKSASPTVKKRFSIPGPNSKVEPRRLSLPGSYSDVSPTRRLSVSGAVSNGRLAEAPAAARSPRLPRNGKTDSAIKHSSSSDVRRSTEMRRSFKY